MTDFSGKRVLIAGDGVSGRGAYAALVKCGAVCSFLSDGLPANPDLVVVSPGIPPSSPVFDYARSCGAPVIGELELGARLNRAPIVAVTGTNGKTTTVTLIKQILGERASLVGNVGNSFALAAVNGGYEVAVVEASSFQLETIETFHPHAAAILNIAPDHLDRYPDIEAYAAAKMRIAENMTGDDLLLIDASDVPTGCLKTLHTSARIEYVALGTKVDGAYTLNGKLYVGGTFLCDRDRLKLQGEHNVKNALAAARLALYMGASVQEVLDAFGAFDGVGHRIEFVRHIGGKSYYNDSKGTNIAATLVAARAFDEPTCLLLGGSDKGLDYLPLFTALPKSVTEIIVMGQTADKMLEAAAKAGVKATRADDLAHAVFLAAETDCKVVLLSPAAASFDCYSNYAARGSAFIEAVNRL